MSSIANRKFTDMKQIEFQQNGSGEISAMLTQPLLENSSTYMCEVTDLQCTIGRELAFPKDQWLFTITSRPHSGTHTAYLNTGKLKEYIELRESGHSAIVQFYGVWQDTDKGIEWQPDSWVKNEDDTFEDIPATKTVDRTFYSPVNCYSAMDLVYQLSNLVKIFDKKIKVIENDENEQKDNGDDIFNWTEERYHIGLGCDAGGRLVFRLSQYFRRNYMIITSKLFQKTTGYHQFIGEFSSDGNRGVIHNIDDFVRLHPNKVLDQDTFGAVAGSDDDDEIERVYNILEFLGVRTVDVSDHPHTAGDMMVENGDMIPIQDGIDIRKKIIVEVSLPISHTLAWNGKKESTRYVLQEFIFPSESLSFGFDNQTDFTKSSIKFREKSLHGEMVLLNGGTTLALKKLQEGQMQAFRVSVLLEYDDWDNGKQEFVRKKRPLNLEQGGFFYLKLLFTKETI